MRNATSYPIQALVVDDDPIIRLIHRKILTHEGCQVTEAADGEQAVALATGQLFDVILMDINMPKMNGLDATIKIRAHENGLRHTPIIGITSEYERETYLAKGMDTVLDKPIKADTLVNALQQAFSVV